MSMIIMGLVNACCHKIIRMGINASLPKKIKEFRELAGMTQERLAELSGCTRQSIYNYEHGRQTPEIEILTRIAKALNASIDDLISAAPPKASASLVELAQLVVQQKNELEELKSASGDKLKSLDLPDDIIEALTKADKTDLENVRIALGLPLEKKQKVSKRGLG